MTIENKTASDELFGEIYFRDVLLIWGKEASI